MLYWISFATDTEFRGAVIVEAKSLKDAPKAAGRLGINPGGQACVVEVPGAAARHQAWPYRNRLLQREEIDRVFGPRGSIEQLNGLLNQGEQAALVCEECNEVECRCAK